MQWLEKLDPVTAQTVDRFNKRRVVRALEVCILSGTPFSEQQKKASHCLIFYRLALKCRAMFLYQRISERVDMMMKLGLLKEVEELVKRKYPWSLPSMSGIGYRQFKDYFEKKSRLIRRLKT